MQGLDKAFLEIGGRPIIAGVVDKLRSLVNEVIVVTNSPCKYRGFNVKVVKDRMPRKGPLMGIYSGLKNSSSKYNFVAACDMPFINERLVKYMIKNIKNFDIFIPRIDNKFHPLCGIYSKNCVSVIERLLSQDRLKVSDIFSKKIAFGDKLKVKFISKKKLQSFDKDLLCLENINTPQDLNRSRRFIRDRHYFID